MKKLLLVLFALVLLAACDELPTTIDLTLANDGATLQAKTGQTINITLDSNITTGYKWNLVSQPDAAVVKFVSSKYNEPFAGGIGAGGTELWQFQTMGRGTALLKLAYFRPFDPSQVAREFSVTIVVQ